jgi:uncharacterized membrane protein YphA (DoxX/SURF4 family)
MPALGRWTLRRALILVTRLGLGAVFLFAAYSKLKLPWISFAATVYAYQLLPDDAVVFVARALPWFELLLGALLILGIQLRWVAAAASVLLLAFFAVLVRSYARGMDIDCGCFGPGDRLSWKTLAREGLLLGVSLALTVAAFRTSRSTLQEGVH